MSEIDKAIEEWSNAETALKSKKLGPNDCNEFKDLQSQAIAAGKKAFQIIKHIDLPTDTEEFLATVQLNHAVAVKNAIQSVSLFEGANDAIRAGSKFKEAISKLKLSKQGELKELEEALDQQCRIVDIIRKHVESCATCQGRFKKLN